MDSFIELRWTLLCLCCIGLLVGETNSLEFTARQGMMARQRLHNTLYPSNSRERNEMQMEMTRLWTQKLEELSFQKEPLSNKLWVLEAGNFTLIISYFNRSTLEVRNLEQHKLFNLELMFLEEIALIKSTAWQNHLFFLICFKNYKCTLFTVSPEFDPSYRLTLSASMLIPIDAQFFVQSGNLFLSFLYLDYNRESSYLRTYKWYKTTMYKVRKPDIKSTAISLLTFNNEDIIIYVLGCYGHGRIKNPSQVWYREPSGRMERIQYLPTSKPISIKHFVERDENFLLIQEEDLKIYLWTGTEFVQWNSETDDGLHKYSIYVSNNVVRRDQTNKFSPFIMFTYNNELRVYMMAARRLEKVFGKTFFTGNPYQNIVIQSLTMCEEKGKVYMFIQTKNQQETHLSLYQVYVHPSYSVDTDSSSGHHSTNTAEQGLKHISEKIDALETQTDDLVSRLGTLLLTNKPATIESQTIILGVAEVRSGNIFKLTNIHFAISEKIESILLRIPPLQQEINSSFKKLKSAQANRHRHLVFEENVYLKSAKINSISANTVNGKLFQPESYLLTETDQKQTLRDVKVKTLKVDWLLVNEIGNKSVNGLFLTNLTVNVPVTVAYLKGGNLNVKGGMINGVNASDLTNKMSVITENSDEISNTIPKVKRKTKKPILKLQDNTVIENLQVDKINGIHVTTLIKSLFVKWTNTTIYGNLHFEKGFRADNLEYQKLTPSSDKYTENVYTDEYMSGINSLHQYQTVHHSDGHTYVPYYMGKKKRSLERTNPIKIIKHKVKVVGNLKVDKIIFKNSSLSSRNQLVPTKKMDEVYWTKSNNQVIPDSVHFTKGITLKNHSMNPVLNGKYLNQYASLKTSFPSLTIENVHVDGNLTTQGIHNNEYDVIEVKHLLVNYINDKQVQNVLSVGDLIGPRVVAGNLSVKGSLNTELINDGINICNSFETAVYIDEDAYIEEVKLENILAREAEIKYLNGFQTDRMFTEQSVNISGNLDLKRLSNVSTVNYKPTDLSSIVYKHQAATIHGKKTFHNQVMSRSNITVRRINNRTMEDYSENLLRTSSNQVIKGFFTFTKASIKKLTGVDEINNIKTSRIQFIDQPYLKFVGDVRFTSLLVEGNITANKFLDDCNLPKVSEHLVFEHSTVWSSLLVNGDCVWPATPNGRIQHLMDFAVTDSANQNITGTVVIKNLHTQYLRTSLLNDKNITFIIQDSLSKTKENQVISGNKQFIGKVECDSMEVKGDIMARSGKIDGVNVKDIDARLVRNSVDEDSTQPIISGHKTFLSGFETFHLICKDGINGIKSTNLASETDKKNLPPLIVRNVIIRGNLQVETVNGLHIDRLIKDCIYLNHTDKQNLRGQLNVIGNVTFNGDSMATSINDISNKDLVFTNDRGTLKEVFGCKNFSKSITIDADVTVDNLNSENLLKKYKKSVFKNKNTNINGSLSMLSEVDLDTIYAEEYFVGGKKLTHINRNVVP